MDVCPRCGTRLLPGALACINCELPIASAPTEPSPPPYALPQQPAYPPQTQGAGGWPPYGAPAPGYPPYGYPGGPPGPAPWSTNGMSVAGLILSILWLGGLGSLLAVIFGHVARGQIRKRPQRGSGMALASLIIGYIGLVLSVVFWASLPTIIDSDFVQDELVQEDMRDAAKAEHDYLEDTGTYTTSAFDLEDHGFDPLGRNTILVATKGDQGFCIVGAHNGSDKWYLYDSWNEGLTDFVYPTREAAEADCSVGGSLSYVTIA